MRLIGTTLNTNVQADKHGPSITTRSPDSRRRPNISRNGPTSPPGLPRMRTSSATAVPHINANPISAARAVRIPIPLHGRKPAQSGEIHDATHYSQSCPIACPIIKGSRIRVIRFRARSYPHAYSLDSVNFRSGHLHRGSARFGRSWDLGDGRHLDEPPIGSVCLRGWPFRPPSPSPQAHRSTVGRQTTDGRGRLVGGRGGMPTALAVGGGRFPRQPVTQIRTSGLVSTVTPSLSRGHAGSEDIFRSV